MGLQIKWDRGTRVYIKLAPRWKGRVQGLCGNYNGDALDDLKTPSSGVETSATIFGDSWKLQDFCARTIILHFQLILNFKELFSFKSQRIKLTRASHILNEKFGLNENAVF